ncbi:MAG: transposase [Deltaproteobacteria bacterium]|nr:transposase [Deltaproteobacteria bacterium]
MGGCAESGSVPMYFERNDAYVIEAFRQGEFDYLEGVGEVCEADFFRALTQRKVLEKLAATYPSPCQKHDVPLWVYISSDISMRFHGVHPFHAFPYVVRSGGLVQAFGPQMGHRAVHPQTGDVSLRCEGFNEKNEYDRQTPCDPDYLRKMARRTDAQLLQAWFNRDVVGIFKQHHVFDREGIFIGDASYLFVPDNPRYEGSSVMLFDEHNHPVESQKLTPQQRARCTWRRCYKLVSLIHTNRAAEFFLYAGLVVTAGQDHECPLLYRLVEEFVRDQGRGVMKRLILDRGFLDGVQIGRCKRELGIEVLIPVRHNMEIFQDVVGLAQAEQLSFQPWAPSVSTPQPIPVHRPERIKKREEARQKTLAQHKAQVPTPDPKALSTQRVRSEVAAVNGLETFSTCPVPLHALVNREVYADGHLDYWVLVDTAPIRDPGRTRQEYGLRQTIEERHRQLKCFSDLESFTSRAFPLIVNQVVFVLLTYSLLQWFLLRISRKELNPKTRTLELLRPTLTVIVLYYQNYMAFLTPLQHQELVLTLSEPARKKILAKTRRLRRSLAHALDHARPP